MSSENNLDLTVTAAITPAVVSASYRLADCLPVEQKTPAHKWFYTWLTKIFLQPLRNLLLKLSLAGIGLLFSLLMVEATVRIFLPVPSTKLHTDKYALNKLGYVSKISWTDIQPEFTEHVQINSLGYRDVEIDPTRPVLIVLGDSQTFGTGSQQGERASDHIRNWLDSTCEDEAPQVLNVAMPGAWTGKELQLLQDIKSKGVQPLHTLLLVVGNDHHVNHQKLTAKNNPESQKPHSLRKSLREFSKLVRQHSMAFVLLGQRASEFAWFREFYKRFKLGSGLNELFFTQALYTSSMKLVTAIDSTGEYIEQLQQESPITIALVPDRYKYDMNIQDDVQQNLVKMGWSTEQIDFLQENKLMAAIGEELNVAVIDPHSAFAEHDAPASLYYAMDGHLTPMGQRLLADSIIQQWQGLPGLCGTV